jgi:selenide,water dikinase
VIVTAAKAEMLDDPVYLEGAVASMTTLNKKARDAARPLSVHAATDVTGFSLLGHGMQMAQASGVTFHIHSAAVPILPGALEAASYGLLPEGMYHNLDYVSPHVSFAERIPQNLKDLLCDPQTSGGLLFASSSGDAETLVAALPGGGRWSARGACFRFSRWGHRLKIVCKSKGLEYLGRMRNGTAITCLAIR